MKITNLEYQQREILIKLQNQSKDLMHDYTHLECKKCKSAIHNQVKIKTLFLQMTVIFVSLKTKLLKTIKAVFLAQKRTFQDDRT